MADRPVCDFRWKQQPWKSQTTVSCVTGSVAYWLHVTSFQAVRFLPLSQSHACNENSCTGDYFICQDLQTHKQTNKPTWQAGRQPMHIVHSQSAGNMYANTLFVLKLWEKSKGYFLIRGESKPLMPDSLHYRTQCDRCICLLRLTYSLSLILDLRKAFLPELCEFFLTILHL